MIDRERLTKDLQRLLERLEDDLRERVRAVPELRAHLDAEWKKGKEGRRTSEAFEVFAESAYTQSAVAWVLSCVFVRHLEDNDFLDHPWISGPGARATTARDWRGAWFGRAPTTNERDFLQSVFDDVGRLPAMAALLTDRRNPLWSLPLSGDGARELYEFWHRTDPATGGVVHDFTDPSGDTRFLGDLYQDLSESARKRFALLQTPVFVEEFLLDRTLDPAIEEFGLGNVTLIDPTCGSGHFLLGAFARLIDRRMKAEPAAAPVDLAQRALLQVAGVDLNPYAIAITRFRLLLAALRASGVQRLKDAPAFEMNLAAGDSLIHGGRPGFTGGRQHDLALSGDDALAAVYDTEDADALRGILGRRYHVVVGNPPYITVKDSVLNDEYRRRYGSCYRQYSLGVPFTERFFDLAIAPEGGSRAPAGFVGLITANSFMKREFGKRLIEEYIPRWDLTHVIDTSGAYIPGHGTPTVILIGRSRRPTTQSVRAVLGIRGEPSTPQEPSRGLVWSEIIASVDRPGVSGSYVSVADRPRDEFQRHPWSLGGGGALELMTSIEGASVGRLSARIDEIGTGAVTREDEVYFVGRSTLRRRGVSDAQMRSLVEGDVVRDWAISNPTAALWPYDPTGVHPLASPESVRWLWPWRAQLARRVAYGQTQIDRGLPWFAYSMFFSDRYRTPLSIAFAFVATHNHFVLDRGGKVFNRSAPVIKLKAGATEEDHFALLGLLNCSVACFWMKQVFHCKGGQGINEGLRGERWEQFYEFDGTKIRRFPIVDAPVLQVVAAIDHLAGERAALLVLGERVPSRTSLDQARERASALRNQVMALQEELDWLCHVAYGLASADLAGPATPPPTRFGERAFEIALARAGVESEGGTTWFARHGATPIAEAPTHWPAEHRTLVERRVSAIANSPELRLIEQPEYKRRWNDDSWEEQERRALRAWILDRLERLGLWADERPISLARLTDRLRGDAGFVSVVALYAGAEGTVDLDSVVRDLILGEGVPFIASARYTDRGLDKRRVWERTWDLQRQEDAIDARTRLPSTDRHHLSADAAAVLRAKQVGEIPVPPKYDREDYRSPIYWSLRGKLDVPKERFILYPGAERDADPSPVVGWAGWDHLQQAQALAAYYLERRQTDGWSAERLTPLLTGLEELIPWLKQWHNAYHADYGMGLGDYFDRFVDEQVRELGLARDAIRAWKPATAAPRRRRARTTEGEQA